MFTCQKGEQGIKVMNDCVDMTMEKVSFLSTRWRMNVSVHTFWTLKDDLSYFAKHLK